MTIRKTRYVAASDNNEAWMRFRVRLDHEDRLDAAIRAEEMTFDDRCEEKCKYTVWEVHIDLHVDEGPEQDDEWGYGPNGEIVDLR